jgi:hypothetical protein
MTPLSRATTIAAAVVFGVLSDPLVLLLALVSAAVVLAGGEHG